MTVSEEPLSLRRIDFLIQVLASRARDYKRRGDITKAEEIYKTLAETLSRFASFLEERGEKEAAAALWLQSNYWRLKGRMLRLYKEGESRPTQIFWVPSFSAVLLGKERSDLFSSSKKEVAEEERKREQLKESFYSIMDFYNLPGRMAYSYGSNVESPVLMQKWEKVSRPMERSVYGFSFGEPEKNNQGATGLFFKSKGLEYPVSLPRERDDIFQSVSTRFYTGKRIGFLAETEK